MFNSNWLLHRKKKQFKIDSELLHLNNQFTQN